MRRLRRSCGFCAISAISAKRWQLGHCGQFYSITLVYLYALELTLKPQKHYEAHKTHLRFFRHQRHQSQATAARTLIRVIFAFPAWQHFRHFRQTSGPGISLQTKLN